MTFEDGPETIVIAHSRRPLQVSFESMLLSYMASVASRLVRVSAGKGLSTPVAVTVNLRPFDRNCR